NVGMIWVGWGKYGDQTSSPWIWDFIIYKNYRGKGYGKEALIALDKELKERGKKKVSLQVFGHNSVAINLYQKLGYKITNIVMSKELETNK
ncbi:MAG: GNAT family N-acetyltransferase, partial [Thermoplasmatales archaeon]